MPELTIFREALARGTGWSWKQLARLPRELGRRIGEQALVKFFARVPNRGALGDIKAKVLWALNDRAGAFRTIRDALALAPRDQRLIVSLARLEFETGSYGDAELRLRGALDELTAADGNKILWQLVSLLTQALVYQGKSQEAWALVSNDPATRLAPDRIKFLQAHVCRHSRRYDEAENLYTEVLAQKPNDLWTLWELGELLGHRGRFAEAEVLHQRLVSITGDPTRNARNYSHALLAQGRVREGWARNMLRVENSELKKVKGTRVWDGSDLARRSIFVIVEGGTGDELRDAVCYQELSQRAARVTISCEPRLETLLRRSFPNVKTLPVVRTERISAFHRRLSRLMDKAALEEARRHDFCVLSPDLFYFFKPQAEDYGKPSPYLVPDAKLAALWRERVAALPAGPKIGIGWTTIRQISRRFAYYTKLADWGPILTTPGAVFVNVQYGDHAEELRQAEQRFGIRIHQWPDVDLLNDFESAAGLIAALDLVLVPNTTTLELAGGLGTRAWYMVNERQTLDYFRLMDSRTGQDRSYPSVRIFMAEPSGNPTSVIAQVATELQRTFGLSSGAPASGGTSTAPVRG